MLVLDGVRCCQSCQTLTRLPAKSTPQEFEIARKIRTTARQKAAREASSDEDRPPTLRRRRGSAQEKTSSRGSSPFSSVPTRESRWLSDDSHESDLRQQLCDTNSRALTWMHMIVLHARLYGMCVLCPPRTMSCHRMLRRKGLNHVGGSALGYLQDSTTKTIGSGTSIANPHPLLPVRFCTVHTNTHTLYVYRWSMHYLWVLGVSIFVPMVKPPRSVPPPRISIQCVPSLTATLSSKRRVCPAPSPLEPLARLTGGWGISQVSINKLLRTRPPLKFIFVFVCPNTLQTSKLCICRSPLHCPKLETVTSWSCRRLPHYRCSRRRRRCPVPQSMVQCAMPSALVRALPPSIL